MTGPPVVIRFGAAYSDAAVERVAADVAGTGLVARIEPFGPPLELFEPLAAGGTAGLIALEVPAAAAGVLPGEALAATLATLVDAAQRRRRRQLAEGEVHDVALVLVLPGDVQIVVTPEAAADRTDQLMAAVLHRQAAGTLTAGAWQWDPA